MKAHTYSTLFSMHEQQGTFLGIDACSITNFGDFSFCSKLLHNAEVRSLRNRPDINALLTQLAKEKVILVQKNFAKQFFWTNNYNGNIEVMLNAKNMTDEVNKIKIKRSWPKELFPL
eukprot:12783290-Ditylum_brightwellii.AAC.1